MTSGTRTSGAVAVNSVYILCGILFSLVLLYHHFQLITFETPLDYNEAGMLTLTDTIASGKNPYSLESQPTRTGIYPALYNRVVAPLTSIFGNTLVLHRAVSAFFILGSCLLCFAMAYRESHSHADSFAAACIFYAGLLYYSTPIAGPTGFGLFLFLSSIVVPWLYNFSNRSLCLALVLGILAFYAKQYFVAGLGFVALYLFLAISKSKGLIFGICAATLFIGSLLIVHINSPYFLDNTIFAQGYAAALASSNKSLLKQYIEYGQVYLPILLALAIAVIAYWVGKRDLAGFDKVSGPQYPRHLFNLKGLHAPLLRTRPNYVWYCFLCSALIITLSLGKSAANHLSYFFQLLSPFLLAGTVSLASRSPRFRWLFQLLVIIAFYKTYAVLQHNFSINSENWQKIRAEIASAEDIFASPVLLAEIMKSGKAFYENGHTRYVVLADNKPGFLAQESADETPGALWTKHVGHIRQKLKAQEFDLILLDQWMAMPEDVAGGESTNALLKNYYYRSGMIVLSLAERPGGGNYRIQVWKPLHDSVQNPEASQ
jgi:hypothetical protein